MPFQLLRAVRSFVCPEVSELNFCDSHLIDGVSADGISLDPNFCKPLRDRVKMLYGNVVNVRERTAVDTLRMLLDAHSQVLSPLLAIEERLLWAWLINTDDASFRRACDLELRDIIGTAIFEKRQKIYRWASAASQRLPIECFDGQLGWMLNQLCRTRRIRFPSINLPADAISDLTLLDALADGLPDRLLGLYRDGEHLEFGPIDARRHVAIPVVDTDPMVMSVAARRDGSRTTILLYHSHVARIPIGRETVTIKDLRGRNYTLQNFVDEEAPETAEARNALEGAMAHQASADVVRFDVLRPGKKGYVVSLPDLACTAFLAEPNVPFNPGDHGLGLVVDVIVSQRRVILRLPHHIPNVAGERRLPRGARIKEIPSRFQVQVLKLGRNRGTNGRSVHVIFPAGHPLWALGSDGVGRIRFPNAAYQTANDWGPEPGSWVDVVVVSESDSHVVLRLDLETVHRPVAHISQIEHPRQAKEMGAWPDSEPLKIGQNLELKVTSVFDFGAFLALPDGRQGLLHVSKMVPQRYKGDVPCSPGDTLRVRVESIDSERRRISMTQEPMWKPVPLGKEMDLEVVNIVYFGAFLNLPDGRQGLLHVSEMLPPQQKGNIRYQPGDRLRVRVISEDPARGRISFTQCHNVDP